MERSRFPAVVIAATALAAAGCGGRAKTPAPAAPSAAPAASREAFATSRNCAALRQLPAQVAAALGGAHAEADTAPDAVLQRLAAGAPEEIRSDLAVISAGYTQISTALAKAGAGADSAPDPDAVERLQKVLAEVDQVALTQANQDVRSWVQRNC